jgi:hypothetical protein
MDAENICLYNDGVICDKVKCAKCGWNPKVAKARLRAITGTQLYRVPFTGYCEVYAASPEEAAEKADTIEQQFFAHYDYGNPICPDEEE